MKQRAKKIKMLILDVDGVMTGGEIIYDSKGGELKCFNVADGMGLGLLKQAGIKVAIITAKGCGAVLKRARDIGAVEVKQKAMDKLRPFRQILKKYNLNNQDICFIGDDLPDLPLLKRVGLAITVPNACAEAKKAAHYVTKRAGGKGAVREVVEIILRSQNKWQKVVKRYLALIFIFFVSLSAAGCAQENKSQTESAPAQEVSDSQKELEEAPDEQFSSFSVSGYGTGGKKEWDLEGKSADIMSEEIQMSDVTGKVYGEKTNITIVADEGNLNRLDNSVYLEKNVLATTEDGATLAADYLDWDAQNEKLSSEAPVEIKRGMMQAEGTGLIAEPELNLVQLKKDVTVKISRPFSPTTVITCDGPLDVDYENNLAIFYENVKVNDNRGEIFADKMNVYFSTEDEQAQQVPGMEGVGIEKIVATGEVEIHHGSNISYSEKAVYDTATGKVTLTGRPKLVIYSTEEFGQMMGSK